jgi:hypothetical protein
MSSPLAIGAVSAVLRNLLDNGMIEAGAAVGATIKVTAVAPDIVDLENNNEPPQLNLFLHQVTPNLGWRNEGLPSRSAASGERLTNAPLALDLHYLLTAYGRVDFQAEILLGYAMHLLHERPVLDRDAIRRALNPSPLNVIMLPPAFQALAASDLADQVELVKVAPVGMSSDEMSKLWTAIQRNYRPSASYIVSVVLIEGTNPVRSPLPVLTRGMVDPATKRDRGVVVNPELRPPLPTLTAATPDALQPAARLGEPVVLTGFKLAGAGARVLLAHRLLEKPLEIPVAATLYDTVTFTLPDDAAAQSTIPAGLWSVSLALTPAGEASERVTNAVGLLVAPAAVLTPTGPPLNLPGATVSRVAGPSPHVRVVMASRPQVRPEQNAQLVVGATEAPAQRRTTSAELLEFRLPRTLAPGAAPVRLRVDGIDSLLVRRLAHSPEFDPTQTLTVPA